MRDGVFSSVIWRFGERICAQAVTFIVSVVLARILMPEDYGIITMTTIFITISNVFVTSGFGMALIQKKEIDELDYSTIYTFGLAFSIFIYLILFISAPYIADFYNEKLLVSVIRIMSLKLPLAAINSVQQARISRNMQFRKFFWVTLIGTIVSAILGVILAIRGFGVWALVAQYLTNSILDTVNLGISLRWHPKLGFSFKRYREMFGFGWRILCSDLIATVYSQLRSMIIGKRYSSADLAYYDKGNQIPHIFVTNVGVAISSVLFPAMSKKQSDPKELIVLLKKSIGLGTFLMFPIMGGLSVIAKNLTIILLTEKWVFAVPYMQIACFVYAFEAWSTANLQSIKALGKSSNYLILEITKKTIAVIILIVSIRFGVFIIAASEALYTLVALIMTINVNKKLLDYGFFEQIKDIALNMAGTLIMVIIVYFETYIPTNIIIIIVIQVLTGIGVYTGFSVLVKNTNYAFLVRKIKGLFGKMRHSANNN